MPSAAAIRSELAATTPHKAAANTATDDIWLGDQQRVGQGPRSTQVLRLGSCLR
jgi:hypothetical protein